MADFQDLEATQVESRNELKILVLIANHKVHQFDGFQTGYLMVGK